MLRQEDVTAMGQRLRIERERLKLTGATMAAQIGVTERTLRAYEGGERAPTVAYLTRAHALGVEVGYVLFGPGRSYRVAAESVTHTDIARALSDVEDACQASGVTLSTYKKGRLLAMAYRRREQGNPLTGEEVRALVELAGDPVTPNPDWALLRPAP